MKGGYMSYRVSLSIAMFFAVLSAPSPGVAACDPAAIEGKWFFLTRFVEAEDVAGPDVALQAGWGDCVMKLNGVGKIKKMTCVLLELGEPEPTTVEVTDFLSGRFQLSKSCRITGQLIDVDDEGVEERSFIRGFANRDVDTLNGVLYGDGDGTVNETFTAVKK
jgi:hypothetical protein